MNANASLSSIRVVSPTGEAVTGVGKYRYIGMLAEGGMADVYLAVTQSPNNDRAFEKLVVIKQLRQSLAEDPSFITMFMDEARLAARLNHPNVVQTLEVGIDEPTRLHFLAMEFLEGVAYVRFARKKDVLPAPLAFHLRILIDALRGLHYAHELRDFDGKPLNVVHRDVSPQNVMLTWAGGVKVLDFGIAKAALAAEARPEDFKGKLEYMAPEQACREDVDRRADIFSVGVMLHEALTRRRLFRKGDDKLVMLVEGRLPNVLDVAPSSPRALADICNRAMAYNRDHRYATANQMADELEGWLAQTQPTSAREVGAYIAEMFASTRAKITTAVEDQLALFRKLGDMPLQGSMPLHRLPFTDYRADILDTSPARSLYPKPSFSAETVRGIGTPSRPDYGSVPMFSQPPLPPPIPVAPPMTVPPPPPRASNLPLILVSTALGGVLLAGAAAGVWIVRARKHAPPAAVATASASASTGVPPDIDYTIRAMPPEAHIVVDGAPVANPAIGKRPADGDKHTVRFEAPGYEPREETVIFDRNVLMAVDLHPVPAPPAPAPEPTTKRGTRRGGR